MKRRTVTFNHNPWLRRELPAWRARVVLLAMFGGFLALGGRALYLQGVNHDFLQAQGASRYARTLAIPATRGVITDRHGKTLAQSAPVSSASANPGAVDLEPAQARELARLLGMNTAELNRRLDSRREFVYLKRHLPPALGEQIEALGLSGINLQTEYRRYYPEGEVMAHMVGFTNIEGAGQEGVELAYDQLLTGIPGLRRVIRDRRGRVIEGDELRAPRQGENVALALDSKIQYLAWSALRDATLQHKAKAGAAVVLDVRTGEILALVNTPTFNPNNRRELSGEQLRNRVFTDSFEPGSVMKPFVVAMALDSGKVRPDSTIDVGNGRLTIGTATISDSHRIDKLVTVSQVIQKSSNIGTVKMAQHFQPQEMWQLYDQLGFGRQPGLGFPGESAGRMRPARSWRPIEQATMSYGHGISVSLIQMARAYMAFARDGSLLPLSMTRLEQPPGPGVPVFSPRTAAAMRDMLEAVTLKGGTGTQAQVAGYRVGGKTGTALKTENGRYVKRYVSSFVGMAPMSDPRVVVAVMLDEPSAGSYYAGAVVGPLFARVTEGSLRALGIAPDAPLTPLQLVRQPAIAAGSAAAARPGGQRM